VIYPIFASIWLSFYDWDGLGTKTWLGLDNYVELFDDEAFYTSLYNNIIWLVLYMLAVPAGCSSRCFSTRPSRASASTNRCSSFPFVISQVVVGLIFSWFYAPNFGLFYNLIEWLTGTGIAVLADDRTRDLRHHRRRALAADRLLHDPVPDRPQQCRRPTRSRPRGLTAPRAGRCCGTSSCRN
jgi:ABC-type sugar transport system permease subunit